MSIGLVESNPEREKQKQQEAAQPLARARLLQRLLAPTPNLPQFLFDIAYTQAVVVAGTEACAFLVEPAPPNPDKPDEKGVQLRNCAHIRPDNSDESTRQKALQAFSELIAGAIGENQDGFTVVSPANERKEPQYCLITLLRAEDRVVGATAVVTRCLDDQRAQQRLEAMQLVAGYFDLFLLRRQGEQSRQMASNHQDVLQYSGAFGTSDGFANAANNLCNEIASRSGATRVSIGWVLTGLKGEQKVKLKSLSHTEQFDKKQELSVQIVRVMEEALDQNEIVQYDPAGEHHTQNVTREAAALSRMEGGNRVISLPLRRAGEPIAVMTLEFAKDKPASEQEATGLAVAAELLAPQLYDRYQNDRWLITKAGISTREVVKVAVGPRHWTAKLITLAGVTAVWVLCGAWVPGAGFLFAPMHNVRAPFELVPKVKRTVSTPLDGAKIKQVHVRPNDDVTVGQVLIEFDDSELQTQHTQALAEAAAKRAEVRVALEDTERNRTAEARQAQYEAEAAEAKATLYQSQIAKARVVAPVAGKVLRNDLRDRVGDVVKQGDVLFEIADPDPSNLQAEVSVRERDVQLVAHGTAGQIRTTSRPDVAHDVKIDRVVPAGEAKEGKNVFRVYAQAAGTPDKAWVPGLRGEASLEDKPRPLVWQWSRPLVDWVRLKLWL